jgi:hypothetical protein
MDMKARFKKLIAPVMKVIEKRRLESELVKAQKQYFEQASASIEIKAQLARARIVRSQLEVLSEKQTDTMPSAVHELQRAVTAEVKCRLLVHASELANNDANLNWMVAGWKFNGRKKSFVFREIEKVHERLASYQLSYQSAERDADVLGIELASEAMRQQEATLVLLSELLGESQ